MSKGVRTATALAVAAFAIGLAGPNAMAADGGNGAVRTKKVGSNHG